MFVLDTSTSIRASFAKFACDAPVADSAITVPTNNSENSTTTPSYSRYYCAANTTVQTSLRRIIIKRKRFKLRNLIDAQVMLVPQAVVPILIL